MAARTNTTARSTATAAGATVTDARVKTKARARRVFPEATARVVTPEAIVPEDISPLKATVGDDAALEQHLTERLSAEVQELWAKLGGKLTFNVSPRAKTILLVIAKVLMYAVGAVATAVLVGALSAFLQAAGWNLFIIAVLELFTFILGCLASWYVSDAAISFIASGGVKRNVDRVFGKARGFFSRADKGIAA